MQLISDIINNLIDDEKSIYTILLKTKVLASRFDNKLLLEWVNSELNGYQIEMELPKYRKNIGSHIKGDYLVGFTQYTNQPIPTHGIKERFGLDITKTEFRQSISALEQMVAKTENNTLMLPFSAEIIGYLENNWRRIDQENGEFLNLVNARKIISSASIKDILSQVRNRLLDFMLEIDKQYGNLTEIKDLTNKNREITQIMKQTIINASGDGNIVTAGNNNEIEAKIKIDKSSKKQLEDLLRSNGVTEEEITELIKMVDNDNHNLNDKIIGSNTNSWMQKMIGKAINGTWNIGVGAAGELLATSIGNYLGF